MNVINAQWLESFVVLCETGHFTRAATRLGMTQPGVSQHLKKLEQQIGEPLISRDGKGFSPTPAGESVLAFGRERRAAERNLRETLLRDDPAAGEVAIACSGSFAMQVYPHILAVMQESPDLAVRLEAAPQDSVLAGVVDGRFDLGIADHDPHHLRLDARHLGQEELCLVVPRGAMALPASFATLDQLGFVAHPDGMAYADELFAMNFPEEFRGSERLHVRTYVNQISQIPSPVASGIGYTILPRSGVDSYPGRDRLDIASLPHRLDHDLWMISRRGRLLPARVQRLAALLQSVSGDNDTVPAR